ncbi:Irregular chiasm C-roughest protein [Trachymyrmex cornetzi]|uniref:Irregular chiasm C-roughest protein n=1 Tax=Trachymyrmex cornetzi TaxID=471704 RepID=A0A151J977_9HYME|nr:Irregular chiasm C-roughest protein [Trachymyrmex cornetzi]
MEAKTVAAMNVTNASSVVVSTLKPFTTTEVVYQRFAIEPMDQTAVIGSRVTLPCRVLDQKGPIQWTKDDFGLGAVRNLTGYERYAMIGSDEEGKYKRIRLFR